LKPWLIPVGGFLGAGKTSLLLEAGGRLRQRGHRVAILTNDQADGLVDTAAARTMSFETREVAGACFCCAFSRFVEAAAALAEGGADVILAEPLGSCTDIAATVLRPLELDYAHLYRLAPFTVLVDATQYSALHAAGADAEVAWLYRQQMAEADILAFSKCDLGAMEPELGAPALRLSTRTGQGIDVWLEEVLSGRTAPGARLLMDIDYDRYARAEARLAWLNAVATVRTTRALAPAQLAGPLVEDIDVRLTRQGARIAHLKTWTESAEAWLRVSLTENGQEPSVEGDRLAPAAREFRVVVNLRAQSEPGALQEAVEEALAALPGDVTMDRIDSFRPSPPRPERRAS
jgi:hypothetical protein